MSFGEESPTGKLAAPGLENGERRRVVASLIRRVPIAEEPPSPNVQLIQPGAK